ncbi:uncharacterized protein SETTUDRAFT_167747 [Exserohilum turcica Et28A]|uniref:Uncharacterized protein n=1 Tax=Exserohilum turcicum (strain 28A) TaxID=671987 RepID=R0IXA7_EXST2|nr:uncharacterized protein SETTUDRAFT_167747 [Exserohilum turcica Et28A]EOA89201.1 hypothetical protein SETTUDRAFT_167747 [Exserohilum turcica Et28A]
MSRYSDRETMSPLSKADLGRSGNGTVASPTPVTKTTPGFQLKPTIVATLSSQEAGGCYDSFVTGIESASTVQTNSSTRVITASSCPSATISSSSTTTSAAFTTPLHHTNYSTPAITTSSPTLNVAGIPTQTWETRASSSPAVLISTATAVPTRDQSEEMPVGTKVGLAMIPITVGICAWAMVLLFLWRRRKAQQSHQRLMSISSRPEKNYSHLLPSLGSTFRASRVFTMTAFHSQDTESQRTQITSESFGGGVHALTCDQVATRGRTMATSPPRSTSNPGRRKTPSNADSPIDESSPFRLTREGTRRNSLGAEISHLWPAPPPSAWTKRQEVLEQLPSSRFGRDMSLPRSLRPSRRSSQSPPRSMRSIKKPAIGESWPLL